MHSEQLPDSPGAIFLTICSKCHFSFPSDPDRSFPSEVLSLNSNSMPFCSLLTMDSSLEQSIFDDMKAYFAAKGQRLSECTGSYLKYHCYWVYVPVLQVSLFMLNQFKQDDSYRYPPIPCYQLMVIRLTSQTTKTAFVKRILKFYPGKDFLIPTQHLNDKKWTRTNKH